MLKKKSYYNVIAEHRMYDVMRIITIKNIDLNLKRELITLGTTNGNIDGVIENASHWLNTDREVGTWYVVR